MASHPKISVVSRLLSTLSLTNGGGSQCFVTTSAVFKDNATVVPPKKPLSSYFRFTQEIRPQIKAANPQLGVAQLAKVMGLKWNELPEEKKNAYVTQYEKDLEVYKLKKAEFEAKLEEKNLLQDFKLKQREELAAQALKRASKNQKKLLEDLGKPKRSPSASNLYMKENYQSVRERFPNDAKAAFRVVSEQWANMSEAEKKKYVDEAERLREQYLAAIESWTARMEKSEKMEEVNKAMEKMKKVRRRKKTIEKEKEEA